MLVVVAPLVKMVLLEQAEQVVELMDQLLLHRLELQIPEEVVEVAVVVALAQAVLAAAV
jgi:hypothetical protein